MNPYHKPKGTPEGGQFGKGGEGFLIRSDPLENDISSYLDNPIVGNRDPIYKLERQRNVNKAFYDGGYVAKKGSDLNGFESAEEAEAFIQRITTEHSTAEAWRNHKDMVETYLQVAKGYFNSDKFDLVIDGHYSKDGAERNAAGLMREFSWSKQDVKKILMNLSADDFVNSGANVSEYRANKGTVVMVFAPRVKIESRESGNTEVNLYVKLVLNPHPDTRRHQTEMQVISFKEATRWTCLYTGEVRQCRK